MTLNEDTVRDALASLQEKRLAGPAGGADSRVTKYEHRLQEVFNFDRRETAMLCVLLLRGPQTPGELRSRSDRMYRFEALDDVQSTIQRLMDRQPPLVAVLPRQPGTKESRYVHLFGDADAPPADLTLGEQDRNSSDRTRAESALAEQRISALEDQVSALKKEFAELRSQLSGLAQQSK
jgi:uncharacterized protein YceH (UPF0502 family)